MMKLSSLISGCQLTAPKGTLIDAAGVGTHMFFAPEMFSQKKVDAFKTDLWSLGVTFYYIITKQYPWRERKCPKILK